MPFCAIRFISISHTRTEQIFLSQRLPTLLPPLHHKKQKKKRKANKNKLTQNERSWRQMFKEQTFSSWKRELDFSSHASTRINPKPIFITPVLSRSNHALHISIFFVCECMHKSRNLFPPLTHFQNTIFVLGGSTHALTILQTGESIYLTTRTPSQKHKKPKYTYKEH